MTEDLIEKIENIVMQLGYECVHVGLKTDFGRMKVQILIDSLGGINLDDCERVSKSIDRFLDEHDSLTPEFDNGRYYLEVSSPGVERPLFKLSDYERFEGREARLRLNELLEERKSFTGELAGVDGSFVLIRTEDNVKRIPFEMIRGGNLIFRFSDGNEADSTKNKGKKARHKRKNKNQEGVQ